MIPKIGKTQMNYKTPLPGTSTALYTRTCTLVRKLKEKYPELKWEIRLFEGNYAISGRNEEALEKLIYIDMITGEFYNHFGSLYDSDFGIGSI